MAAPATAAPAAPASAPAQTNTGSNTGQGQPAQPGKVDARTTEGKAVQAAEIRKMKLKLDGREVELPESEVIAYAQQGKASTQRFQEAAKMRAEAEQILRFAQENPVEFFKRTGKNARQWAEEFLVNELQVEAMSPEQRKARENEEKLRQYEASEKKRIEQQKQEQLERDTNMHRERLDKLFTQALHESGLPKTPFTVKRMAELQLINIKKKLELGPSQLAKLVREDFIQEQKALLGGFEGDQLIDFLGPELVKKLSKAQIAKLKAKGNPVSQPRQTTSRQSSGQSELSWEEYQRRNRGKPVR